MLPNVITFNALISACEKGHRLVAIVASGEFKSAKPQGMASKIAQGAFGRKIFRHTPTHPRAV